MKKRLHLTFGFMLLLSMLIAQNRTITGNVSNKNGEPLIGATVFISGTQLGTTTDLNGNFTLDVPKENNELLFQFLGYVEKTVSINDLLIFNVVLEESSSELDQIVVVGYGEKSKRLLTTSVASVNEEVFKNNPASDVQNSLQGRMPGVVFTNTSGSTNSASSIRIRGVGSISAGNQPLFVVDGLVLSGRINAPHYNYEGQATNPYININPNDIESVDVLKDAAATAIYGARGSNGVILITTKKGDFNTQPKVSIGYWAGFSEPSITLRLLNGQEWAASWNQAALNVGRISDTLDVETQPSTDWVALSTQKGFEQEASVSVTGGTKTTKYYFGGTARDEDGIVKTSYFKRYSLRANIDQMLGDKVTVGISIAPSRVQNSRQDDPALPFKSAFFTPPNIEAFDEFGYPKGFVEIGGVGSPYTNLVESWSDITSSQVLSNIYLSYSPLPGLNLKTSLGIESTQLQEFFKNGSRTYYGYSTGYGIAYNQETFNYNWTALATWKNTFAGKHNLDVTAGFNMTKESLTGVHQEGTGFADDRLLYIGSATQIHWRTSSYTEAGFTGLLARANYGFENKYLLTISARYDGSSRFGAENRYGFFPAISAGWIVSDEAFFNLNFINFLKLRSSYGVAGNAEIGDFAAKGLVRFGQNYNELPGYSILNIENEQLGWERNLQWDAGLEFALLKNRIRGSIEYFIKDTKDLLLEVPVPSTNGITVLNQNVGEVRNQGFEFELSADILTGAFQWTVQANGATLKNEVRRLVDTDGDGIDNDIFTVSRFLFRPGEAIGTFYMVEWAGVDPENGDALFWNADKTEKLANKVPLSNRRIVGTSIPRFTGGFSNIFRFKNFELSAFFQFKTGYQINNVDLVASLGVSDYFNPIKDFADDVWTPDNRYTNVPQNRLFEVNGSQNNISRNLYDGDYLRLKNLTLGYVFPAFGDGKYRLRLFAAAQNLWLLTNYPFLDPDAGLSSTGLGVETAERGLVLSPPPSKRTYLMGFNLDF